MDFKIQNLSLHMRSNELHSKLPLILTDNSYVDTYGLTFSEHFVSWYIPKYHEPQLTPICTEFLENINNRFGIVTCLTEYI